MGASSCPACNVYLQIHNPILLGKKQVTICNRAKARWLFQAEREKGRGGEKEKEKNGPSDEATEVSTCCLWEAGR